MKYIYTFTPRIHRNINGNPCQFMLEFLNEGVECELIGTEEDFSKFLIDATIHGVAILEVAKLPYETQEA